MRLITSFSFSTWRNLRFVCLAGFVALTALFACNGARHNDAFYADGVEHGYSLYSKGERKQALRYVDSLYSGGSQISDYAHFKKYRFKYWYYFYSDIKDTARIYIDSMLQALEANRIGEKYPADYAMALNTKADEYYEKDDLNKAFSYYYKSKVQAEIARDSCALGNQTYHMGMVCYRQEKYTEAISYFHVSYTQNRSCGNDSISFYRNQELLNNVALCYSNMEQYDSALHYYNSALSYINRESKKYGSTVGKFAAEARAVIYGNLSKIYYVQQKYDSTEYLLKESIDINRRRDFDNVDALFSQVKLATLYTKLHRSDKALRLLNSVRDSLAARPNDKVRLRWLPVMSSYYREVGQPLPALDYQDKYINLKDSINARAEKTDRIDVHALLNGMEAQYQNQLLQKDHKVNRLLLFISVGVVIAFLVITTLISLNYIRSRKNVKVLMLLNEQVSEQKKQLETAADELKKTNEDKDKIMSIVAHDLRSPISGIMFLSKKIMSAEYNPANQKSLEIISRTSGNALVLINDLLEFNGNVGEGEFNRSLEDINELVQQAVSVLHFRAEEKKQQIICNFPNEECIVYAVPEKLVRAFSNIISNAIKFSKADTIIYITVTKDRDKVLVEVMDNGIGIPEEYSSFIFDAFSKAQRPGTNGEKSVGLGLSICRQLVESNKGRLWYKSSEGLGTSFFIELPLAGA